MNVPKLRFKEFTDEWTFTTLKDVAIKVNRVESNNSPIMMISAEKGFILQSQKYSKDMTGDSLKKYITLYKNELAYNHGASKLRPYGSVFMLLEDKARIPFVYHCFKITNGYNKFFSYYLNRYSFGRLLKPLISSTARMDGLLNISFDNYFSIKFKIPQLKEQEKIANLLTTVDKKITNLENTITSLENQKKGLLQQIFSQKLRFKDKNGNNYPNWEKKKLGDIGSFSRGGNLSKSDLSKKGTSCILYGELYTYYNEFATEIKSKTLNTTNLVLSKKYDVLLPLSGETAEDISTCTCIFFDDIALGSDLLIFRSSFFDGRFMSLLLKYKYKYKIAQIAQGKSIVHISEKNIKNINIKIPCIEEQQNIADFILIFTKKLENQKAQLEHWKQIKKGLLQQMFV